MCRVMIDLFSQKETLKLILEDDANEAAFMQVIPRLLVIMK